MMPQRVDRESNQSEKRRISGGENGPGPEPVASADQLWLPDAREAATTLSVSLSRIRRWQGSARAWSLLLTAAVPVYILPTIPVRPKLLEPNQPRRATQRLPVPLVNPTLLARAATTNK